MAKRDFTLENVRRFLDYNPETGVFTSKMCRQGCSKRVGEPVGTLEQTGYISVSILGKRLLAHRLAWFYVYGEMPEFYVDHKNMVRTDNRLSNLRAATHMENSQNTSNAPRPHKTSSPYRGVFWEKSKRKWYAKIRTNYKQQHLGYYDLPEQAHDAYVSARLAQHKGYLNAETQP